MRLLRRTTNIAALMAGAGGGGGAAMTWNSADKSASITLGSGDLRITATDGTGGGVRGTAAITPDKFYYEALFTAFAGGNCMIGVANLTHTLASYIGNDTNGAGITGTGFWGYNGDSGTFTSPVAGDIVQIAGFISGNKIWYGINNAWINRGASDNPNSLTGGLSVPGIGASWYPAFWKQDATVDITARFLAGSQTYPAPTGFTAVS